MSNKLSQLEAWNKKSGVIFSASGLNLKKALSHNKRQTVLKRLLLTHTSPTHKKGHGANPMKEILKPVSSVILDYKKHQLFYYCYAVIWSNEPSKNFGLN